MNAVKTLFVVTIELMTAHFACAQTWTQTSAPSETWSYIASSADGSRLIAVGLNWNCYVSTNSGSTWTTITEPQSNSSIGSWYCIASSADGTKLLASTVSSTIFVSTNSGTTWLSNNVPSVIYWGPVAMSADGTKMVAAAGGSGHPPGYIYTSTNLGVTWTPTSAPSNYWSSVACSADGNKIVAAVSPGSNVSPRSIYTSTNAGFTWTRMDSPNSNLVSVASSADGMKLVMASQPSFNFNVMPNVFVSPGLVYTSTNSGTTWVSNNVPNTFVWQCVASSADGSRLIAVGQGVSAIYTSTNSGATWISNSVPNLNWAGVASSADGDKLVAVPLGGGIYTLQTTPSPQLNLSPSPTNLTLAWTVPSTNFVLQQSTNLASWTDATNPPVLNLTNLQNQVMLSPSNSSGFYRLKTP